MSNCYKCTLCSCWFRMVLEELAYHFQEKFQLMAHGLTKEKNNNIFSLHLMCEIQGDILIIFKYF